MPNARRVSLTLAGRVDGDIALLQRTGADSKATDLDPKHTVMVFQFGQFIDHDLTHTPNRPANCACDSPSASDLSK